MEFSDIYNRYAGQIVVGVFLIAVLVQYLIGLIEKKEIKRTKRCPHCSRKNLHVEISKTIKGGDKVSLLKNIGGGVVSLELAALLLLYQFYRLADNWITTGGKATGIIKESLKMKLAFTGVMLIFGILFAIVGILLIWAYFQKKEKSIILACNDCKSEFTMDGSILQHGSSVDTIQQPLTVPLDSPDQSEAVTENMELCKKCGSLIETSTLTCPNCGHTQWGVIGAMAVVSLLLIGFVVYRILNANSSGWIFWGGVVLGILLSAVTISFVNDALRKSSDPPTE